MCQNHVLFNSDLLHLFLHSHLKSVIFFREQAENTSQNFVIVRKPSITVCSSQIGMRGGSQTLNLGHGGGRTCYSEDTIIHEFMHALGVFHYQNRPDRDQYVTINFNNIKGGENNYNYKLEDTSQIFGIEYDVESFMHYGAFYFAIDDKKPTMESKV